MTRKHAKELLPIITAYAEGKTIQYDDNAGSGQPPDWRDMTDPQFRGDPAKLRIKPEPDPYAELKAAKTNGAVIQHLSSLTETWIDLTGVCLWSHPVETYRIKPTPKLVPMTSDDLPPVVWVQHMDNGTVEMVITFCEDESILTFNNMYNHIDFKHLQWSPDRKTWNSFMKEVAGHHETY